MHARERLKGRVKRAVRAAALSGAQSAAGRSVILTYHSVGARDHEMNVAPREFAEQMKWLADHTQTLPIDRAAVAASGVAITFDDGYRDNLTEAAPVLDALRISAAVFVVAGRVGGHLDHDDPPDETARLMTWDELRDLSRGGWTIGGHTMTHCRLALHDERVQKEEIAGCKHELETRLGMVVNGFAYPYGSALDFTPASTRIAQDAGYAFALSNCFGPNTERSSRFALRRIGIDRTDTLASFVAKVQGRLDRLAWLDSAAGIRARRWANRLLRAV